MKLTTHRNHFILPKIITNFCGKPKNTIMLQIIVFSLVFLLTAYYYSISGLQPTVFIAIQLINTFMLFCISLVTWYTFEFSKGFFQVIGSSCLIIGFLELFHLLSFPGMSQFFHFNFNDIIVPFWFVIRILEAQIFLFSGILANKAHNASFTRLFCFGPTMIMLGTILVIILNYPHVLGQFSRINPLLFSGFIITILLLATTVFWHGTKKIQDKSCNYIISGIIANVFAELLFALNMFATNNTPNLLGHIFRLISFVIIFHALFGHSVRKPFHDIETLLNQTITSVSRALDRRDKYTYDHSVRVAQYAQIIGKELKLSNKTIERLQLMGLLHDIGKISIPDKILRKNSSLTAAEWDLIKSHPLRGAEILEPIDRLGSLIAIAEHHERIDGKGYPFGKCGDQISLEAKILAVADTFDAMTSDRPYRPKKSIEEAVQLLQDACNTQLDTKMVDAFVKSVDAGFIDPIIGKYS